MIYIVLAVRDRAANAFMRPIFVNTVGQAVRSFSDEVNRAAPDNAMHGHPEDFDLYELGKYDEETGRFECLESPRQVAIGKDQVRS